MSSIHPLLINPANSLADNVDAQFGVIPEAEGTSEIHVPMPQARERTPQRRIKPRNIRTALKKLWLDEMLLTKQILCPVPGCTMVFSTLQGIQNHYQFCTGLNESGIVRCEFCGEQFLSQSLALEIHMAEEHRSERLMSMSKTDEQVVVKSESVSKVKKFRDPPEILAIPPTPPPDVVIESRRRNVAYSRNQEELIDCEELEGVVRFPLRNLPKGEQEDPLQLPAVMMNLDINLKPKPFSFDDLDENSMMDDTLLSGPLKIKSEPIDSAEDDPQYISNMIKKMPEPDLKTVPPVRKRPRPPQGPDVRFVQVIMRSNPAEPNAAQSIFRDPQFMDAIVQSSLGQSGQPMKKKKKRKQNQQQPVYVVAINEAQEQPIPSHQVVVPNPRPFPCPSGPANLMKKPARSRKQVFPPNPPMGLVQVSASLDQGQRFLQTHTLSDKPQVRQEVIDSFFNSNPSSSIIGLNQPSTSFVEDSSQLVQNMPQSSHHQLGQAEYHSQDDYQTLQVVNTSDVLNIGEQNCIIVPPEAFNQFDGAQLILQDGQLIVQSQNGESCQVVYENSTFTEQVEHADFANSHIEMNSAMEGAILPEQQQQQQQEPSKQQEEHHQQQQQQLMASVENPATAPANDQEQQQQHQQLVMSQQMQNAASGDASLKVGLHGGNSVQLSVMDVKDPSLDNTKPSDFKDDADTTATQAAEALLTLRPQSRCIPTSPMELSGEQLLKESNCEESHASQEVFQVVPEPRENLSENTSSDNMVATAQVTDMQAATASSGVQDSESFGFSGGGDTGLDRK
ncbi:auxin response factor 7 [Galendromus occidentalis]|uniref:Auxin response factor 7 n=1 Tax=Galendromus occidentalis TaxID=34638 RepID=A0AAJ6W0V6_9ACAR|nr:auxin response factor 7 [Galendromus occidentalis]